MAGPAIIPIAIRRGTLAQWTNANPTPLYGEICCIADPSILPQSPIIFLGDGVSDFNTLYASPSSLFRNQQWIINNIYQALQSQITSAVNAEAILRQNGDNYLLSLINTEASINSTQAGQISALNTAIANEIINRQNADSSLNSAITSGDSGLQDQITQMFTNWFGTATTSGQLLVYNAVDGFIEPLPPGNDGDILIFDSTQAFGVRWGAPGSTIPDPNSVELVANENIAAYELVINTGYRANSSTLHHRVKILGFAKASINSGFTGNVAVGGTIENPSWAWTVGDLLFLNGTGSISTTPPSTGFSLRVGKALSATKILIELGEPITL